MGPSNKNVKSDSKDGSCIWRKSYRVDYNRLPLKASLTDWVKRRLKGGAHSPLEEVGSVYKVVARDNFSWFITFSHCLTLGFPKYVFKSTYSVETLEKWKKKILKTKSFYSQIHLGNIRLKQLSLLHPRIHIVGFFSKYICVLEMYLITTLSFQYHFTILRNTLTRLSLIFKILEQPQKSWFS